MPKTAKRKQEFIYTPADVDLDVPAHLEPGVRWLVSTCYFYRVAVWKDRGDGREHWAYLSADLLEKVVGRNVREIRDAAVDAGLIECDDHYQVGRKCMGYRLGPRLRDAKFEAWEGDGKVFMTRFRRFRDDWNAASDLDDLGEHLRKWACKVKVSRKAESVIAGMDPKKAEIARHQVEIIRAGFVKTKYCEYGRFHSNFTRLCREIRASCLTIGGEVLHEIDIVGSQVVFLAELLAAEDFSISLPNRLSPSPSLPYDLTFSPDFFVDLCNARTYEHFQSVHGLASRGEAKEGFFKSVYGTAKWTWMFSAVWPEAGKILRRLKRKHEFGWIPREMQRRESGIVLGKVCEFLRVNRPDVPIVTCHDSISTTAEHLDLVAGILRRELSVLRFFNPATGLRMKGA
jgi:hypothetical protein